MGGSARADFLIVSAVAAVRLAVAAAPLERLNFMGVGIQVDTLNAWYGKGQALYDINIKVAANHATALIGPSGCGKSTFSVASIACTRPFPKRG